MGASTPAIAPPPGPAFVTHVDSGWLNIIGPDITLTQADMGYQTPSNGVDVQGSLDIVVYADTVRVTGTLRNPGRKVVIVARDIVGTSGAIIDVSGPPGTPSYRPGDKPIQTDTSLGAAGVSGDHGGRGGSAGSITLYALTLTGPLLLRAHGGSGGRGQDGHEGETGADGAWGKTPVWVNGPQAIDGDGGQGGRGGDAGDGGPGGNGGQLTICVVDGAPGFAVDVSGGPGSDTGMPGWGGAGGRPAFPAPGQRGGRGGIPGMPGNFNTRPKPGMPGSPGSSTIQPFTVADLASKVTLPLLTMYQQQADAAFLRQDYATAGRYYGLLLKLTANASPTSKDSNEKARAAIGQAALCELSRLRQGLDFFGDRPDWAPALTLGLLQSEITAMLTLTGQLETSLTTLADAQASADAKRTALKSAIDHSKASLNSTQANIDSITNQLKNFEATLREQAAAIGSQFAAIAALQMHLKDDQFRHDHPAAGGCTAMSALQTAGVVIVAGVALDSGVGEIVEAGESLYAAGTVMDGVKNGISLVTSIKSTIDDANKMFDALRGGYDAVKGKIDDDHPDGGKVFASEDEYDSFLQQYTGTYLEQDALDIKTAVHRYFEMIKARNADVLSFNALYLKRERLQVELGQQTAQLEVVAGQLAAQNDPTNTAYITYLQAVDSQVRLYLLRKIEEERHAFLYWSLDNDGSSSPGPDGPTDSSLTSLQAAHLGIAQGIDDWRESLGRAPGKFAVKVTFTRKDHPLAFKAMETSRKLALTLDVDSGGAFFGPLTHVLAETVRLHLPDYDEKTQTSGSLQVNLIHGGTSSFVQLDGQTVVSFTHALRPIFYWYDYEQGTISYDGTIGDDDQGYAGLSPFTSWLIDFTVGRGAANSFIDFTKVNSVALEFHGHSVGPNLKAAAARKAAEQVAGR